MIVVFREYVVSIEHIEHLLGTKMAEFVRLFYYSTYKIVLQRVVKCKTC